MMLLIFNDLINHEQNVEEALIVKWIIFHVNSVLFWIHL